MGITEVSLYYIVLDKVKDLLLLLGHNISFSKTVVTDILVSQCISSVQLILTTL